MVSSGILITTFSSITLISLGEIYMFLVNYFHAQFIVFELVN